MSDDLSGFSLMDLFRSEAEGQTALLSAGLLALEGAATPSARPLEPLMRAAHSLKGAARIVGLDAAVRVAHAMEDCFVAAQQGELALGPAHVDVLLRAVDLLAADRAARRGPSSPPGRPRTSRRSPAMVDDLEPLLGRAARRRPPERRPPNPPPGPGPRPSPSPRRPPRPGRRRPAADADRRRARSAAEPTAGAGRRPPSRPSGWSGSRRRA